MGTCAVGCSESGGPVAVVPLDVGPTGSTVRAGSFTYFTRSTIDTLVRANGTRYPALTSRVSIRNDGPRVVEVTHGVCNVSLDAYWMGGTTGQRVWDYDRSEAWDDGTPRLCILVGVVTRLNPGEEKPLGVNRTPLIDILGDSLSDGRYLFGARVQSSVTPAGMVLHAGEFDLEVARPPLRDSVRHDVLTYRAGSTVSADGGAIQAHVTARLTHAGGALVTFPRECVLTLAAYRDYGRRDAAPRSGAPDWTQARSCSDGEVIHSLDRGEALTFQESVPVLDVLGESRPEGEYFLAVLIRTPTRNLWLSAGSAELRR